MHAMILTAPPQRLQIVISILNDSLESLLPSHFLMIIHWQLCALLALKVLRISALDTFRWSHIDSVFAVGRQNPIKSQRIGSGFKHQSCQLGDEVKRLEYDVRGPISPQRSAAQTLKDHKSTGFATAD